MGILLCGCGDHTQMVAPEAVEKKLTHELLKEWFGDFMPIEIAVLLARQDLSAADCYDQVKAVADRLKARTPLSEYLDEELIAEINTRTLRKLGVAPDTNFIPQFLPSRKPDGSEESEPRGYRPFSEG